jgi:hypothetical protein
VFALNALNPSWSLRTEARAFLCYALGRCIFMDWTLYLPR